MLKNWPAVPGLAGFVLTGYTLPQQPDSSPGQLVQSAKPRIMSPVAPASNRGALVDDNTDFAFAVYPDAHVGGQPGSLLFSPYSSSTALAMTFAGAAGTTAQEMSQALHFTLLPARLHAAL